MTVVSHVTLEQWRALLAVVDSGGYAQAAERLHKSQSALTYAVQKLESQLGVKAFTIEGRKAVLTPTGQLLYRRARALLADAGSAEQAARALSAGWEAEIRLAVEILFPTWLLLRCLERFGAESPHTRLEIIESVLGGTGEALLQGEADLAISPTVPSGFLGDPLMRFRAIPVAHPAHPLHQLKGKLTLRDLRAHRHLVVRDSGSRRETRALSVEVDQRWTVSNISTSIQAACMGYGFAWFPEDKIRDELATGMLKPLPLREGFERFGDLYLILADRDAAGPGTLRLAQIIREGVASECSARRPGAGRGKKARRATDR
jgi:DNA-binding transcriptional LysR family regulator